MKTIKNLTAEEIRKSILQLAIQGKLVKQDPSDEPASELVKRIYAEKQKLIKEGKIKKDKNESYIYKGDDNCYYEKIGKEVRNITDELPFEIPESWTWVRLKNLCEIIFGGKTPKYSKEPTKHIAIGQAANTENGIDINLCKYCTDDFVDNMPMFYYLKRNDVLLNTLGHGTLGRCGIFNLNQENILTDGHLFVFRLFNDATSTLLYWYFVINRTYIEKSSNGTTNQIFLSLKTVGDYLFPLAPLKEQQRILNKVKSFNLLINKYQEQERQLSNLESSFEEKLKASILQYAIEGKLVKQDPNDEPASKLLERIKDEKEKLIKEGKIKRDKHDSEIVTGDDKNYYGILPVTWLITKIGEVLDVYRGGSPRPIESFLTSTDDGVNWVKIGDTIQGGKYIISCKQKIIKDGLSKTRLIQPGDLLLTNSMSFGRPYISKIYGAVHDGWLVFSDFSNSFDKNYLFYLLSSVSVLEQFKSTVSGAVVKNLNIDKVKNTVIPLLSKNEQTRIAQRIDSIFLTL